jgi:septum formation protein
VEKNWMGLIHVFRRCRQDSSRAWQVTGLNPRVGWALLTGSDKDRLITDLNTLPTMTISTSLVLASASRSRQNMLRAAGVTFVADPADIDESAFKIKGADPAAVAKSLAAAKAKAVSKRRPETLIIGSDQMLVCESRWFDKPTDRAGAKSQLMALAGRTHELIAAVTVVHGQKSVWSHTDRARLYMRAFSETFIDEYLDRIGGDAFLSVGAYQVEGLGIQLFEKIEGDIFTIMGMPLLPLLEYLRTEGVLAR